MMQRSLSSTNTSKEALSKKEEEMFKEVKSY
jgi:hypothetical protein